MEKQQDNLPIKAEWEMAKQFFKKNPNSIKLDKSGKDDKSKTFLNTKNKLQHSFIKVNMVQNGQTTEKIFAMAPNKFFLGKGTFGIVKPCYNEQGNKFAIKVSVIEVDHDSDAENEVLELLGRSQGMAKRDYGESTKQMGPRKKTVLHQKRYITDIHIPGVSIYQYFQDYASKIDIKKKMHLALNCASQIEMLHDKNIFHGDVAARNFLIDPLNLSVTVIDFGTIQIIPEGETYAYGERADSTITAQYMPLMYSQEAYDPQNRIFRYSKAMDVYAFGKMLQNQKISTIYNGKNMLSTDPTQRPTMTEVRASLQKTLHLKPNKRSLLKSQIEKLKAALAQNTKKTTTTRRKK